jgi:hypothetical protein
MQVKSGAYEMAISGDESSEEDLEKEKEEFTKVEQDLLNKFDGQQDATKAVAVGGRARASFTQ